MNTSHLKKVHQAGFSLVEILVAVGLAGIVAGFATTMIVDVLKENKRMNEKVEYILNVSSIQNLILKPDDCTCQFQGKTFDSANPNYKMQLSELRQGCTATSNLLLTTDPALDSTPDKNLTAKEIFIDRIVYTNKLNEYNARFNIVGIDQKGSSVVKTIPLIFRFNTMPGTSTLKTINGCGPAPLSDPKDVTIVAGSQSCTVNWKESTGFNPIQYYVHYSTDPSFMETAPIACQPYVNSNSCLVTGLTDNVIYYFSVQSKNNFESSKFTPVVSCKPSTVTNSLSALQASAGNAKCSLTWNPSTVGVGPFTYKIYQSQSPGSFKTGTKVCQTTTTSCVSSGLSSANTYYFSGTSTTASGTSEFSNPEVTCKPLKPPSAPVMLETFPYDKVCSVYWDLSQSGDQPIQYIVYDRATNQPVVDCTNSSSTNQICTIHNLINDQLYNYYVVAANAAGTAKSNELPCKPKSPPPPGP